jgi:hypothetical protein
VASRLRRPRQRVPQRRRSPPGSTISCWRGVVKLCLATPAHGTQQPVSSDPLSVATGTVQSGRSITLPGPQDRRCRTSTPPTAVTAPSTAEPRFGPLPAACPPRRRHRRDPVRYVCAGRVLAGWEITRVSATNDPTKLARQLYAAAAELDARRAGGGGRHRLGADPRFPRRSQTSAIIKQELWAAAMTPAGSTKGAAGANHGWPGDTIRRMEAAGHSAEASGNLGPRRAASSIGRAEDF